MKHSVIAALTLMCLCPTLGGQEPERPTAVATDVALLSGPAPETMARVEALDDVIRGFEDLSDSRSALTAVAASLEDTIGAAREHLHDGDPIEGVLPPLGSIATEPLVGLLLGCGASAPAKSGHGISVAD